MYTYIPPSRVSLPPTPHPMPLGHHGALSWAPWVSLFKVHFLIVCCCCHLDKVPVWTASQRETKSLLPLLVGLPPGAGVPVHALRPGSQAVRDSQTPAASPLCALCPSHCVRAGLWWVWGGRGRGAVGAAAEAREALEAPPAEESSRALPRSPQVTDTASPLHRPAWLLWPAGLRLD